MTEQLPDSIVVTCHCGAEMEPVIGDADERLYMCPQCHQQVNVMTRAKADALAHNTELLQRIGDLEAQLFALMPLEHDMLAASAGDQTVGVPCPKVKQWASEISFIRIGKWRS